MLRAAIAAAVLGLCAVTAHAVQGPPIPVSQYRTDIIADQAAADAQAAVAQNAYMAAHPEIYGWVPYTPAQAIDWPAVEAVVEEGPEPAPRNVTEVRMVDYGEAQILARLRVVFDYKRLLVNGLSLQGTIRLIPSRLSHYEGIIRLHWYDSRGNDHDGLPAHVTSLEGVNGFAKQQFVQLGTACRDTRKPRLFYFTATFILVDGSGHTEVKGAQSRTYLCNCVPYA